jgi:integrase
VASIQARHTRACALARPWTPFEEASRGCSCTGGPTYYVVVREGRRLHRERVGKNRKVAERALRKIGAAVDEGSYRPQKSIRFAQWAEQWLAALERKPTTIAGYRSTVNYATAAFGERVVRRISVDDVAALNARLREAGLSASSRGKHLRVLGACMNAAIAHGYAAANPVKALPASQRPRPAKREAAYFLNAELPAIFAALSPGVYRAICETALKTGARQGELVAATWGDLDLAEAVLRIRRTRTDGHLHEPKSHERRDVDLTPDLVELLGRWWGELGQPAEQTVIFPGATKSGHLDASTLRKELYRAMRAAGVDRRGPTGENRTFHSLRHTYAKRSLEVGAQITWLSRHLGHSSVQVTTGVYGHWERGERRRQAQQLAGAFGV